MPHKSHINWYKKYLIKKILKIIKKNKDGISTLGILKALPSYYQCGVKTLSNILKELTSLNLITFTEKSLTRFNKSTHVWIMK